MTKKTLSGYVVKITGFVHADPDDFESVARAGKVVHEIERMVAGTMLGVRAKMKFRARYAYEQTVPTVPEPQDIAQSRFDLDALSHRAQDALYPTKDE